MMSVSEAIARRQSIRTFGEGDVSEEKINSIISEALRTQSEFNFQPWRVIVIRDRENLSRLSGLAFNQQQIAKASAVLVLCGDMESWKEEAPAIIGEFVDLGYIDEGTKDAFIGMAGNFYSTPERKREFAMRNTFLFMQSLVLLCEARELATCCMTAFEEEKVKSAFNIPESFCVCALLPVGPRPIEAPGKTSRFPMGKILRAEKWS